MLYSVQCIQIMVETTIPEMKVCSLIMNGEQSPTFLIQRIQPIFYNNYYYFQCGAVAVEIDGTLLQWHLNIIALSTCFSLPFLFEKSETQINLIEKNRLVISDFFPFISWSFSFHSFRNDTIFSITIKLTIMLRIYRINFIPTIINASLFSCNTAKEMTNLKFDQWIKK